MLWRALRHQGARRVAVEDPGWRPQRRTAEQAGLAGDPPVRVDAGGLVVSELAAADVDAVVLTPAHHYPTGVVMTAERRGALIAWARQRRALIVEDDYDVEYRFEVRVSGTAAGLHLLAWLPDSIDEHKTATRARLSGVGVHELHRHCTVQAPSPPALLLGYALPTASDLSAATILLADAIRGSVRNPA